MQLVQEKQIVLERARYSAQDANVVLAVLMWMQGNMRQEQITLVQAMWCYNALTRAMSDAVQRAATQMSIELPACFRDLVGPVCRARKANDQRVQLFANRF